MTIIKCDYCNREHERTLGSMNLCEYHCWRAKPHGIFFWKDYKYIHPVRVSQWRDLDPRFNKMLKEKGL